jgi:hypothetical protein
MNSHPKFIFYRPNSDLRAELMRKHFELSHSGAVKLNPEMYFVSTKCQKNRSHWPRGLKPIVAYTFKIEARNFRYRCPALLEHKQFCIQCVLILAF